MIWRLHRPAFGPWLSRLEPSDHMEQNIKGVFLDELRLHGWKAGEFKTPRSVAAMFTNSLWGEQLSSYAQLAHNWGGAAGLDRPDPLPLPGRHHATDPDLSPVSDTEKQWAVDAIEKARAVEPHICPNGLSWYCWNKPEEFTDEDFEQIALCRRWLSLVRPSNAYFKEEGSYQLKHVVEDWQQQYVSNGCFLVAALAMGFKHRSDEKGLRRLNADLALNASDVQSLLWRMNYRQRRKESCCKGPSTQQLLEELGDD